MQSRYYLAASRSSPAHAAGFVDGVMLLPLVLLVAALLGWRMQRKRALDAERAQRGEHGPLRSGATVLAGTVEEEGLGPAITVRVYQRGREHHDRTGWKHVWREQRREVETRPFLVRRADGERVRVEPDPRVFLVDKLDRIEQTTDLLRKRLATLTPGEVVHIVGTLVEERSPQGGAYREGASHWRLIPPRTGRMLVSTEPLADRHRRRARVHAGLALAAAAFLLAVQAGIYLRFNLLRATGHAVEAAPRVLSHSQKWHCPKHGSCHWDHYYRLAADQDDGGTIRRLEDGVSSAAYAEISDDRDPAPVPFFVSRAWPSLHQIGGAPTIDREPQPILFLLLISLFFAHWGIVVTTRPWYERKHVIDRGTGKLSGIGF